MGWGIPVLPTETSADFDSDGNPETLILRRGHALITSGDQTRWQSPDSWQVRQALIADLNRDRSPEAVLLVWRPFKPWPVDTWLPNNGRIQTFHDSNDMSCHLILIGWTQHSFRERWAGSALAQPVQYLAAADLKGNEKQFLITLEGEYDDPTLALSQNLKVWEWNGFGFTVVSKLTGQFSLLATAQSVDGPTLILAH